MEYEILYMINTLSVVAVILASSFVFINLAHERLKDHAN